MSACIGVQRTRALYGYLAERPDGALSSLTRHLADNGPTWAPTINNGWPSIGTQRSTALYGHNGPTWAPMVDNSWPSIGTQRSTALYGHNGPTWAPMVNNGWPL